MLTVEIHGTELSNIISPVLSIVNESILEFDDTGIRTSATDPADVALVEVSAQSDVFESYDAEEGKFGIGLDKFDDVVGMASSDDTVSLETDADQQTLDIEMEGLAYTYALVDPDAVRGGREIPDIDHAASVRLEARELSRAVKASEMVNDHLTLAVTPDGEFRVTADGDTDDVEVVLTEDSGLTEHTHSGDEEVSSIFSIDYLDAINKAAPSGVEIEIHAGDDIPLELSYVFADENITVRYLVAPRIQST